MNHHPSCQPNDVDLMHVCSQCGEREHAVDEESVIEAAWDLQKVYKFRANTEEEHEAIELATIKLINALFKMHRKCDNCARQEKPNEVSVLCEQCRGEGDSKQNFLLKDGKTYY